MKIQLNGEPYDLAEGASIADLVAQLSLEGKRFAVEVNEQIVPRGNHSEYQLASDDVVEVVVAIGGG